MFEEKMELSFHFFHDPVICAEQNPKAPETKFFRYPPIYTSTKVQQTRVWDLRLLVHDDFGLRDLLKIENV